MDDKPFYGQVIVEKGFRTREEAVRWVQEQDTRLTLAAEVDTIETHIWEPGS